MEPITITVEVKRDRELELMLRLAEDLQLFDTDQERVRVLRYLLDRYDHSTEAHPSL